MIAPSIAPLEHAPNMSVREAQAWKAVTERDASFDGRFFFAVETTGVYCRPSCPARRPRRENVSFYESTNAAERAGFRACKRCRPQTELAPSREIATKVKALLDEAIAGGDERAPTLEALGQAVGTSPFHLQRVFVRAFGVSPREYVSTRRAERFRARAKSATSVLDAAFDAGYGSSRAVYDAAPNALGMTPGAYRRGGAGERILYTVAKSPHGHVLVATSARGVVKVMLGERVKELEGILASELPHAEIVRDDDALRAIMDDVLGFAERGASEVPLDLRGTAFELRVWSALRRIRPGETRTYLDIAKELGVPRSSRAVGRACAMNPVSLVVPCHRVVGTDGKLHGFRWGGVEKKRALLDAEANDDATSPVASRSPRRSASPRRRSSRRARP